MFAANTAWTQMLFRDMLAAHWDVTIENARSVGGKKMSCGSNEQICLNGLQSHKEFRQKVLILSGRTWNRAGCVLSNCFRGGGAADPEMGRLRMRDPDLQIMHFMGGSKSNAEQAMCDDGVNGAAHIALDGAKGGVNEGARTRAKAPEGGGKARGGVMKALVLDGAGPRARRAAQQRGRPTGPYLERTRLTDSLVTGEVLEWKGKFGWIKPHRPVDLAAWRRPVPERAKAILPSVIQNRSRGGRVSNMFLPHGGPADHPKAAIHRGKLYVHKVDLEYWVSALTPGSVCRFHVYSDANSLGAEDVTELADDGDGADEGTSGHAPWRNTGWNEGSTRGEGVWKKPEEGRGGRSRSRRRGGGGGGGGGRGGGGGGAFGGVYVSPPYLSPRSYGLAPSLRAGAPSGAWLARLPIARRHAALPRRKQEKQEIM
ncbi:unnamed protein product, partial [Prorocentrum cordatum]